MSIGLVTLMLDTSLANVENQTNENGFGSFRHSSLHSFFLLPCPLRLSTMTYSLSITPGQPIVRQLPHKQRFLEHIPLSDWHSFCDGYDAIVVGPYQRAKYATAAAFVLALFIVVGTMTLTDSLPSGNLFLMGPCVFALVALVACLYMFRMYPKVSHQLQALCEEYSQRMETYSIAIHYQHNDTMHDLKDHRIVLAPVLPDIETAVPAANDNEWKPLLQLRSLWNSHNSSQTRNNNQ